MQSAIDLSAPEASTPVHWMPFKTSYSGAGPVADYFVISPAAGGSAGDHLESCIRGRELKGRVVPLPAGYVGALLTKTDDGRGAAPMEDECCAEAASGSSSSSRAWAATARFSQLHCWNHDVAPSSRDPSSRCFDWLQTATLVHAPVDLQQVTAKLSAMAAAAAGGAQVGAANTQS